MCVRVFMHHLRAAVAVVALLSVACPSCDAVLDRAPRPKEIPSLPPLASLWVSSVSSSSSDVGCIACNNSQTCCDGATCCSDGAFCCESGNSCCQDTCCSNLNETCCSDPINGGVCCESEWSFCCKPQPSLDLPSRCCPRWYVCCDYGEYGCCNPDTGRPMTADEVRSVAFSALHHPELTKQKSTHVSEGNATVFALMLEPGWWSGNMNFDALTLNTSGALLASKKVSGFRTGGEEQRQFMYDRQRKLFHLLQANFDHTTHGDDLSLPIRMWTINPLDGSVSSCNVTGAVNEVTGYHLTPDGSTVVFATYWLAPGGSANASGSGSSAASQSSSGVPLPIKVGYKFYHLSVDTCEATEVAQSIHPPGSDNYAGWFHDVSPDGSTVYRLGFQDVVTSTNFGLSATTISGSGIVNASTRFKLIPRPDGTHEAYISLNLFSASSPASSRDVADVFDVWFVSMAPTNNVTEDGDLSVYLWSPKNPFSNVTKLATFPNAHVYPVNAFGPISECLAVDAGSNGLTATYAALVVSDSPLGSTLDTISLAVVGGIQGPGSIAPPSLVTEAMVQPVLLAETVSPSGVGL